jgi:hypothetical protein
MLPWLHRDIPLSSYGNLPAWWRRPWHLIALLFTLDTAVHLPNSRPPALPPPLRPRPPPLHRGLLPSQGKASPWACRLSMSLRTPAHTSPSPSPSTKDTAMNLSGSSAENRHLIFVVGSLRIELSAPLRHNHSILATAPAQPSYYLLPPSRRRFATV